MTTPFLGLLPRLDDPGVWPYFHSALSRSIADALARLVVGERVVEVRPFVWVRDVSDPGWELASPHVVGEPDPPEPGPHPFSAPTTILLNPIELIAGGSYVRIGGREPNHPEAVVAVLTHVEKRQPSERRAYRARRNEWIARGIHVLEIDLTQDGDRIVFGAGAMIAPGDFLAACYDSRDRLTQSLWTWSPSAPCPVLPVPLRWDEPPLALDLDACVRAAARATLSEVCLALPEADAAWARDLLSRRPDA